MYLKQLRLAYEDLAKALKGVRYQGSRIVYPDFRIHTRYATSDYPGLFFHAIQFPPDLSVRTQFFKNLADVVGMDAAHRLAIRARTVETEADLVIYFPAVDLIGPIPEELQSGALVDA